MSGHRFQLCQSYDHSSGGNGMVRRFVNELVLEEESDLIDGRYTSHFAMDLEAMEQIGANGSSIANLLSSPSEDETTYTERLGASGRFVQNPAVLLDRFPRCSANRVPTSKTVSRT